MSAPQRPKIGVLSTEAGYRTGGRKMDTWKFRPTVADRSMEMSVVFEVFLDKNDQGIVFRVETADIPRERWNNVSGTDIRELRQKAEEAAQREVDLRLGLTWSDWLEVRVSEQSGFPDRNRLAESGLSLSYRVLPRGENAQGAAYTVVDGRLLRFPTDTQVGPKDERDRSYGLRMGEDGSLKSVLSKPSDSRDAASQFTYLPDTPENRQGLQAIVDGIEQVGQRLQAFLRPDAIALTLQRAAAAPQTALLAAPDAAEPEGPARRGSRGP